MVNIPANYVTATEKLGFLARLKRELIDRHNALPPAANENARRKVTEKLMLVVEQITEYRSAIEQEAAVGVTPADVAAEADRLLA